MMMVMVMVMMTHGIKLIPFPPDQQKTNEEEDEYTTLFDSSAVDTGNSTTDYREREKKWESKRKKPEKNREYSNKRIEMKTDYINLKRVSCFKQTV